MIGLQHWLQTPPGRFVLAWEQAQIDRVVADIFGYYALQLGNPALHGLAENRMPHRWLALDASPQQAGGAELGIGPALHSGGEPVYAEPAMVEAAGQAGSAASMPERKLDAEGPEPQAAQPTPAALDAVEVPPPVAVDLRCDFAELPFPAQSLDLVVLPHTLEWVDDPHACLREVERVLVPNGQVVITGFNAMSLWGARQFAGRFGAGWYLPQQGEFIAPRRARDWLRLLGFEITQGRYGCYRPAVRSQVWLQRWHFMDAAGDRWWPVFGATYLLAAIKRVPAMRLVGKVPLRARERLAAALRPAPTTLGGSHSSTTSSHEHRF